MKRRYLAALCAALVLTGCQVQCGFGRSVSSPTFPAAANAADETTVCLPAGFGFVAEDAMGGLLLAEEQPAHPRAYTCRHRRVVECGADSRACPCAPIAGVLP